MAYLQAYISIVAEPGGLPVDASAGSSQQAVTMVKPGRLFADAAGSGKIVPPLDVGMLLYPTGPRHGVMWEVEDELGNRGWVSSLLVELSRQALSAADPATRATAVCGLFPAPAGDEDSSNRDAQCR